MNICRSLSSQPTTVINLLIGSMGVKSEYIFEVFCNIRCGVTESFIHGLDVVVNRGVFWIILML